MYVMSICECCDFVMREDKILVFIEENIWFCNYIFLFIVGVLESYVVGSRWIRRLILFFKLIWSKLLVWKIVDNNLEIGYIGRLGGWINMDF